MIVRRLLVIGLLASFLDCWGQLGADRGRTGLDQQLPVQSGASRHSEKATLPHANGLVFPLVKSIVQDQWYFWSAPQALVRPTALKSFLPFAGLTGILIAGDSWMSKEIPSGQVHRSRDVSNYATLSLAGTAAAAYAFGRLRRNDQLHETGALSAEAALDGTVITYALQRATMRHRLDPTNGRGAFFAGGDSFPSTHAALAWSLATVIAHEYPGPLTQLLTYGLASTVTLTRVTGKQHFPSDAVVGSAIGWYLGRQVYRSRHNPELEGTSWNDPAQGDAIEEEAPNPRKMGSPYVALDSWVYPAIERLAAFGYVGSAFTGLKPWTRMECAQMVQEAEDRMLTGDRSERDLLDLRAQLTQEFAYELALMEGGSNATVRLESVYTRVLSVSGSPLTDSVHFGQTFSYDFGRPSRRGTNAQSGAAFRGALGPAAIFIRGEFQHAPSAPALSAGIRNFMASSDQIPVRPASALDTLNRPRLLDAYVALNVRDGWQLSFGKQSLSWGPGAGGSFLWSDNIEPIPMLRLTQSESEPPGVLRIFGPLRIDNFIGRLEGHTYIPQPYIYGNKINFKPLPNLELGFGRTVTLGGKGGTPLTAKNFLLSFFGQTSSQLHSVPGDSHASFDWTFNVPKVRNYLVFYGDWYADDDFLPFLNPPKNPFRTGIYLTRFPWLRKLDFRMEAASTQSSWYASPGNLNYWNNVYRDGYTSNGNLIGNTVGRDGRFIQCWLNYWISSRHTLQFMQKHSSVSSDFVPRGGAWQDYSFGHEISLRSGWYVKSQLQYEHLSRYPILFSGPRSNVTAMVEIGFLPHTSK